MKVLCISVALLCGLIYANAAFQCETDGTFPNPQDCSSYYVCVAGTAINMSCPSGLYFDPVSKGCNTPDKVDCDIGVSSPTTDYTTISTNGPTEYTTNKPPTTGSDNEVNCPPNGTVFLPDPESCNSFYVCIEGSAGKVDCPPNYGFDPAAGSCQSNFDCSTSTPPPSGECPEDGTAKLPNPVDCASYIFCVSGQPAIINCPDGLLYNVDTENCDKNAQCSISSVPTQKPTTSTPKTTTEGQTGTGTEPTKAPPSVDCEGEEDGQLLPNPDDCSSFYECTFGVPVLLNCPPGLEFNADNLTCDTPANANCEASKFRKYIWRKA